ncbi:MAG TPA: hypothetical protein VMM35_00420 [Longimicrobiales bacterium]|nr:hypothetical protein [Longimicrobiales bacterium]
MADTEIEQAVTAFAARAAARPHGAVSRGDATDDDAEVMMIVAAVSH